MKCSKFYKQMFIEEGLLEKIKQLNKEKDKNKENKVEKFNISVIRAFN